MTERLSLSLLDYGANQKELEVDKKAVKIFQDGQGERILLKAVSTSQVNQGRRVDCINGVFDLLYEGKVINGIISFTPLREKWKPALKLPANRLKNGSPQGYR